MGYLGHVGPNALFPCCMDLCNLDLKCGESGCELAVDRFD